MQCIRGLGEDAIYKLMFYITLQQLMSLRMKKSVILCLVREEIMLS